MRKRIGFFSSNVIRTLGLDIPAGTPIYIADSNIEHMKTSHPEDYEKYGNELQNIIANPEMEAEDGTGSRRPSWRCGNVTPPLSFSI